MAGVSKGFSLSRKVSGAQNAQVQGLDEKTLRMILNSGVGVQLAPIALEVSGLSLVALIECLAASTPESLQLHGFRDIAGVPWQLLGGAEWPQLKKADLAEHLGGHTWSCSSFSGFMRYPAAPLLRARGPGVSKRTARALRGFSGPWPAAGSYRSNTECSELLWTRKYRAVEMSSRPRHKN